MEKIKESKIKKKREKMNESKIKQNKMFVM